MPLAAVAFFHEHKTWHILNLSLSWFDKLTMTSDPEHFDSVRPELVEGRTSLSTVLSNGNYLLMSITIETKTLNVSQLNSRPKTFRFM